MKTTLAFLFATCLALQAAPKHTFLPYPPTPAATADVAADKGATNAAPAAQPTVETTAPGSPVPTLPSPPAASPLDRQAAAESKPAVPAPAAAVSSGGPASGSGGTASPAPQTTALLSVVSPAPAPPSAPGPAAAQPAGVLPAVTPALAPSADVTRGVTPPMNVPSVATPPAEEAVTNTFNFPSIDLNTFLGFYADLVGRTILRPSGLPAPLITFKTQTPLTRTETIQAFDTVLAMNGISTINVGEKFVKVVPVGQAAQEAARFSKLSAGQLPEAAQYVTHVVQLRYVKPSEIIPVLQPFGRIPGGILSIEGAQMLVIRDYAENVKRMLEMIDQIDIAVPAEFVSEVIPIKYALASDISSVLSSLSSGGGATSVGGGAAGAAGRTAGRAGGLGSRPGTGYGTTTPGMPGAFGTTPFGTTTPGATTPGTTPGAAPSFSDRLRSIIQKASSATGEFQILGPAKIIADERTNALLVFASKQDMATIKDIIGKLDVVLAQVVIEALIMEVTLNDSLNYGVSWLQLPKTTGKFTQYTGINSPSQQDPLNLFGGGVATNAASAIGGSGLNWWGKYGNDFDVAVQAAVSDSHVNVLSRPRIQTSHAVPATITIGTSQPIVSGTYSYYGGPQTQFQYQNFGITLNVLPLINPDGLVVMDIDQQIQSNVGSVDVGNGLMEPILANRSANAKVAVRTGETVMLGGFISSNVSNSKSGVPLLQDIPLLGVLFRSAKKTHDRTELIVLIRPTVLQTPEIAAKAAIEEQNRLPLVKRAERDEERATEQRLRQLDKGHIFMDVEPKP